MTDNLIELYENPFKYMITPSNNTFEENQFDYDDYRDSEVIGRFERIIYNHREACNKRENDGRENNQKYINILGLVYTHLDNLCQFYSYIMPSYCNIVTALYLPEDFLPFYIYINNYTNYISKHYYIYLDNLQYKLENNRKDKLLENASQSQREIPMDETDIDTLLKKSKEPFDIKRHTYGIPEIYRNGKKFIRFAPFTPYIPCGSNKDYVSILSDVYMDFYVEFMYNGENKKKLDLSFDYKILGKEIGPFGQAFFPKNLVDNTCKNNELITKCFDKRLILKKEISFPYQTDITSNKDFLINKDYPLG